MPTVGNRLLREAVAQIGMDEVARRLEIPPPSLDAYSSGKRPVNDTLLLKVIDLLESLKNRQ